MGSLTISIANREKDMSYSKENVAMVCSWAARVAMALTFTLPVLSLYGEGEAQPVNAETSAVAETVSAPVSSGNYRIDMLSQAIAQNPDNAALYNSRGWYSFLEGLYAQSVDDYNTVIELGIDKIDATYHASVYHVRGLSYAELGESALAADSLKAAVEIYETQGNAAAVEELTVLIENLKSE